MDITLMCPVLLYMYMYLIIIQYDRILFCETVFISLWPFNLLAVHPARASKYCLFAGLISRSKPGAFTYFLADRLSETNTEQSEMTLHFSPTFPLSPPLKFRHPIHLHIKKYSSMLCRIYFRTLNQSTTSEGRIRIDYLQVGSDTLF